MTTYRNIHGRSIKSVSTDPTAEVTEGEIWYNTNSETFKSVLVSEAWSSSAPLGTARYRAGGAGIQTAALAFGGSAGDPGAQPSTNVTEEYNGSGWTAGGNLNEARRGLGGAGTQTAGLAYAGSPSPSDSNTTNLTEEYDGSAWTAVNTMNTARQTFMGAGTQTAAFAAGGVVPPSYTNTNASEIYDGTNWTASPGTIGTASRQGAASGTSTSGLIFGGGTSPSALITTTQTFDGSTYTTVNSMNTARRGLAGSGTQTAAIGFGGATPSPGYEVLTETWDGTSWAVAPVLATGRQFIAGAVQAPSSSSLAFSGFISTGTSALTEEFTSSSNLITAGAWSAGGNLSTARTAIRGAGIQTAAWGVGGETGPGPTTNATENYDGTSWTGGGNFPANTRNSFAYGTQAAGLSAGGNSAPGQTPYNSASAEYDGSTWTASPGALSPAKAFGAASGVQTSALATGGDGPPNPTSPFAQIGVQSYNGASWSSETDYPTNIYGATGAGVSETAAVVWGGTAPYPGTPNPNTSDYNGSAWTVVAKSIVNVGASNQRDVQGTNQSPSALCGSMGGNSGAVGFYQWNDTAWSTLPNMGTGGDRGGAGTLTGAIAFGGYHPGTPRLAATEEFTPESTTLNVKTLTQS